VRELNSLRRRSRGARGRGRGRTAGRLVQAHWPTNRTASLSPNVKTGSATSASTNCATYAEATAHVVGRRRLILVETISTRSTQGGAVRVREVLDELARTCHHGVGTITDASGRTLSGQTVEAFWNSVRHARPTVIGLNCALGAKQLRPTWRSCRASHGTLRTTRPADPSARRRSCETPTSCANTPPARQHRGRDATRRAHRPHRASVAGLPPRRRGARAALPARPEDNTDSCRAAQHPSPLGNSVRLIEARTTRRPRRGAPAVASGAQVIDINMDEGCSTPRPPWCGSQPRRGEPDVAAVPVMIDSSKWSVIERGSSACRAKGIVNSIKPQGGRARFLEQARRVRPTAPPVVMAFDEQGQADTVERKVGICQRSYRLLTESVGFPARHHLRPEHLRVAPASSPRPLRARLHRSHREDPRGLPARAGERA